jgi:hypothetical protein
MSARQAGSWAQFRGAVEELHIDEDVVEPESPDTELTGRGSFPLYQMLRLNLQRLAHCEFYANGCADGWRVVPPTLATVEHQDKWMGYYCGARSLRRIAIFKDRANEAFLGREIEHGPDIMAIWARTAEELRDFAAQAELLFQSNAPVALLLQIPPIDSRSAWIGAQLPAGRDWKVERFTPDRLHWEQSTVREARSHATALYRFTLRYERQHYLCSKGTAFKVPGQVGKFIILRHARKIIAAYDSVRRELTIPRACRPPTLVDRALTLCAGALPTQHADTATITYAHIPSTVADLALQNLRQD